MDRSGIGFVVGLSAEARLLRRSGFRIGIGGGRPEGAALAAEKLVAQGARALISFGLAGGLNPRLRPGDMLVPRAVIDDDAVFRCDGGLIGVLGGANAEIMTSAKQIAGTREDKALLLALTGAEAIDLESGAVGRVAAAKEIPFAVLRAVADPADRDLPPAALIALNGAGEIRFLAILASVFTKPSQIPGLIAIGRDAAKARAALVAKLRLIVV